jgi:hypothetical protein
MKDPEDVLKCCLCSKEISFANSNNPDPLMRCDDDRCCHECDQLYVWTARGHEIKVDDRILSFVKSVAKGNNYRRMFLADAMSVIAFPDICSGKSLQLLFHEVERLKISYWNKLVEDDGPNNPFVDE